MPWHEKECVYKNSFGVQERLGKQVVIAREGIALEHDVARDRAAQPLRRER